MNVYHLTQFIFLIPLGIYFVWFLIKQNRINRGELNLLWEPVDVEKLGRQYQAYLSVQAELLIRHGYQAKGTWQATSSLGLVATYSTCFLDVKGHCIVQLLQQNNRTYREQSHPYIAITSFLDDGSIVETCNADVCESHFASAVENGVLLQISRQIEIEEVVDLHNSTVQPIMEADTVGLRKLSDHNWQEYLCYSTLVYNQGGFAPGKNDKLRSSFPDGDCFPVRQETTLV